MNNLIQQFTNDLFGSVRSIIINGEPWFVGADVARCLGYEKTRNAIEVHVDNEDKIGGGPESGLPSIPYVDSMGRTQMINPIWINESGLYSLIFSSQLPNAKQFKHWVTSQVLPSMRKIGFDNAMQLLQQENIRLRNALVNADLSLSLKENEKYYTYYWIIKNPNIPIEDKIAAFCYDPDPEGIIGIDVPQEVINFANAYNIKL